MTPLMSPNHRLMIRHQKQRPHPLDPHPKFSLTFGLASLYEGLTSDPIPVFRQLLGCYGLRNVQAGQTEIRSHVLSLCYLFTV